MKQLFLFCAMLPLAASAQDSTGVITYEQTIATNFNRENIPEGFRNLVPQESKSEMELLFTPTAALYRNKGKEEDNGKEYKQENMTFRIETKIPEDNYYTDLATNKITEQKELMDRTFLISHDADPARWKWKFTGRQKKILDMPSSEAVSITDTDTVVVWYTTSIPVSVGPMAFSGLPGMVLEASVNNMHIVATRLEPLTDETRSLIKAPKKGKKVDLATFQKIAEEKTEEMSKQYGGNGNVIIMRQGQ